jgi:AraC-like DNA-binding protein
MLAWPSDARFVRSVHRAWYIGRVRAACDADDYRADPRGAYLAVPRGLAFCARPTLWGFALWGKPSATDVRRLLPLLELELAREARPHASLVDVRLLEAGDPRAFALLASYLRDHFEAFRTRVTRLALVRPSGLLGAMVAGFFQVAGAPYPVRVFRELAAAAGWLRARRAGGELAEAVAAASQIVPGIGALRAWLDGHLAIASLARAARALARAPRSLQRDLLAGGTSYQRELDAARVRVAKRLLLASDAALTEIAYDVGCASPQHFTTVFRRVAGVPPRTWRQARARLSARPARGT